MPEYIPEIELEIGYAIEEIPAFTIDQVLDENSENPIANKAVATKLKEMEGKLNKPIIVEDDGQGTVTLSRDTGVTVYDDGQGQISITV